jgi:LAO/AO transport system kinase
MAGLASTDDLANAVASGDRAALSRAITLVESRRADHRRGAAALLQALLPRTGQAMRVGITGAPGVGKSTLIDALGGRLTGAGHRLAVLAVDPSSAVTGGSILGDKTRMARLAVDASAFVRPSPSAGSLGGVAAKTRETMLLCEAAGFDIVIVETVGTGQSETAVADMVDTFLVLVLPGAGDELQGIKKGVIELADVVAVNKADGEAAAAARRSAAELVSALKILVPPEADWRPPVLTVSAANGTGLEALWDAVTQHVAAARASGAFEDKREAQRVRWMWSMIEDRLKSALRDDPAVAARLKALEREVRAGRVAPTVAAEEMVAKLGLAR